MSRIVLELALSDGRRFGGLHAVVKQAAGSDFERHPLEVLAPDEYDGPLDYERFRNCVERYYRSLVGADGKLFAFTHEQTVAISATDLAADRWCSFEV